MAAEAYYAEGRNPGDAVHGHFTSGGEVRMSCHVSSGSDDRDQHRGTRKQG